MKLSRFAVGAVLFFFALFLLLLLSGVWAAPTLVSQAVYGLTWGHILFLAIHILAVLAAWIHIRRGVQSEGDQL